MRTSSACPPATNVVRFPGPRRGGSVFRDQKSLMEAVYAAGSLPVAPQDRTTKVTAAGLQLFGFVVVEEVQADGSLRRLKASETIQAATARPWRVSKSSFAQTSFGVPS
jgi:hypothetical protein